MRCRKGKEKNLSKDWHNSGLTGKSRTFDRYDTMMCSFGEYVRGEKGNPWSYAYELELYEIILKACGGELFV